MAEAETPQCTECAEPGAGDLVQRTVTAFPAAPGDAVAATPPAVPLPASISTSSTNAFEDPDLDAAALKFDEHTQLLRADVLAHLLDCKRRLGERQQQAAATAAARGAVDLAAKQQELNAVSAELALQQEITKRTGHALFKAARWRRQRTLGCVVWHAWQAHTCRQRLLQTQIQVAAVRFDVRRRAFRAWHTLTVAQLRPRLKAQAAATMEAERQRMLREAHAAASQQVQQMQEVERQLAAAVEAREALAASTRVAFERGVSALNVEALALMKVPLTEGTSDASPDRQQLGPATAGTGWAQAGGHPLIPAWLKQHQGQPLFRPCPATGMPDLSCAAPASKVLLRPAPELAQPTLSPIAPSQPVTVLLNPWVPPGGGHSTLRHPASSAAGSWLRPGTAVSCSLPSNERFRISSMLEGGPPSSAAPAGTPVRPGTAPARRQAQAAQPTIVLLGQKQQQQQQVSQRSLVGQRRATTSGAAGSMGRSEGNRDAAAAQRDEMAAGRRSAGGTGAGPRREK